MASSSPGDQRHARPDRHYRRFEAVCSALYEDLDIVPPGSAGRDHPMPATGLT
jgi:hypothetical protein